MRSGLLWRLERCRGHPGSLAPKLNRKTARASERRQLTPITVAWTNLADLNMEP